MTDQARMNIAQAMAGYLDSLKKHGDPIPPPIDEDVIDIDTEKVA